MKARDFSIIYKICPHARQQGIVAGVVGSRHDSDTSWHRVSAEDLSAADPLLTKLHELAHLPDGWEYGEGRATLPHIYQEARKFYQDLALFSFLKADAFPCADGSLYLVFYRGLRSAELCFWADGTLDLNVEEGFGDAIEEIQSYENISLAAAKERVVQHLVYHLPQGSHSCILDLSVHDTTTGYKVDFGAPSSAPQVMEQASHWWIQTAYPEQPRQFVNISPDTIQASSKEGLSFIGKFPLTSSPKVSNLGRFCPN